MVSHSQFTDWQHQNSLVLPSSDQNYSQSEKLANAACSTKNVNGATRKPICPAIKWRRWLLQHLSTNTASSAEKITKNYWIKMTKSHQLNTNRKLMLTFHLLIKCQTSNNLWCSLRFYCTNFLTFTARRKEFMTQATQKLQKFSVCVENGQLTAVRIPERSAHWHETTLVFLYTG